MAAKQKYNGLRDKNPIFLGAAVSSRGELDPDTIKLQEILTRAYANKIAREDSREDGYSTEEMTARYRNNFRDAIQIAIAKGLVRMVNSAGWPVKACNKYQNQPI